MTAWAALTSRLTEIFMKEFQVFLIDFNWEFFSEEKLSFQDKKENFKTQKHLSDFN